MLRITQEFLRCVFYLYPTKEDAEKSETIGGTGFFVAVNPTNPSVRKVHVYAVTCKHVVRPGNGKQASTVIRVNTPDNQFDTISPDHWVTYEDVFPGQKHDIAVCEIDEAENYQVMFPNQIQFLTREKTQSDLNPVLGDEVIMVGRYIDHAGTERNLPSVRYGNISMLNWEPLWHDEGYWEDSYVVEMRSLSGFSGSPVFMFRETHVVEQGVVRHDYVHFLLLGVQWSHQPHPEYNPDEGRLVKVYSGMSNVIPAWYLDDLLNWETFKVHRKRKEEGIK